MDNTKDPVVEARFFIDKNGGYETVREGIDKEAHEAWVKSNTWNLTRDDFIRLSYFHGNLEEGSDGSGPINGSNDKPYDVVYFIPDSGALTRSMVSSWLTNSGAFMHGYKTAALAAIQHSEQRETVPAGETGLRKAQELLPKLHSLFNRMRNPSNIRIKCEEDSRTVGDASELCRTIINAYAAPVAAPVPDRYREGYEAALAAIQHSEQRETVPAVVCHAVSPILTARELEMKIRCALVELSSRKTISTEKRVSVSAALHHCLDFIGAKQGSATTNKEAAPEAKSNQAGDTSESMAASNTRFAIDGAIQLGRESRKEPPSTAHWLYKYWNIGRQLATFGATVGANEAPVAVPVPEAKAEQVTDANEICQLPPDGWYCTRKAGHGGPCAAHEHEPDRELNADDHACIAAGMQRVQTHSAAPAVFPPTSEVKHEASELPPLPTAADPDEAFFNAADMCAYGQACIAAAAPYKEDK